jgi:subtilisin family serine protease
LDAAKDGENNGIAHMSGTSMATPHVTGAIALYASTYNLVPATKADALSIRNMVLQSTRKTTSMEGRCSSKGRLDINRLIKKDISETVAD